MAPLSILFDNIKCTREFFVSISNIPNFGPSLFGDRHPDETHALVFNILLEISTQFEDKLLLFDVVNKHS